MGKKTSFLLDLTCAIKESPKDLGGKTCKVLELFNRLFCSLECNGRQGIAASGFNFLSKGRVRGNSDTEGFVTKKLKIPQSFCVGWKLDLYRFAIN